MEDNLSAEEQPDIVKLTKGWADYVKGLFRYFCKQIVDDLAELKTGKVQGKKKTRNLFRLAISLPSTLVGFFTPLMPSVGDALVNLVAAIFGTGASNVYIASLLGALILGNVSGRLAKHLWQALVYFKLGGQENKFKVTNCSYLITEEDYQRAIEAYELEEDLEEWVILNPKEEQESLDHITEIKKLLLSFAEQDNPTKEQQEQLNTEIDEHFKKITTLLSSIEQDANNAVPEHESADERKNRLRGLVEARFNHLLYNIYQCKRNGDVEPVNGLHKKGHKQILKELRWGNVTAMEDYLRTLNARALRKLRKQAEQIEQAQELLRKKNSPSHSRLNVSVQPNDIELNNRSPKNEHIITIMNEPELSTADTSQDKIDDDTLTENEPKITNDRQAQLEDIAKQVQEKNKHQKELGTRYLKIWRQRTADKKKVEQLSQKQMTYQYGNPQQIKNEAPIEQILERLIAESLKSRRQLETAAKLTSSKRRSSRQWP